MSDTDHPVTNKRRAVGITFLAGMAVFVVVTGIGGFVLLERYMHAISWNPAVAIVEKVELLCQAEHQYGSGWRVMAVMDCEEAPAYLDAHRLDDSWGWRSREKDYATISYEANGETRSKLILRFLISSVPVTAGERVPIVYDPDDPDTLDRPNGPGDTDLLVWAVGIGAAIWASLTLIAFMFAHIYDGSPGDPARARRDATAATESRDTPPE